MGAIQNSINGAIQSIQSIATRIVGGRALQAYTDETTKKNALTEAETKALQEQAAKDEALKKESEQRAKGLSKDFAQYAGLMGKDPKKAPPLYDTTYIMTGLQNTLNSKLAARTQHEVIKNNINAAKERKESKVTATRKNVGGRK